MEREISSGGVVVRRKDGDWWMAAIEPADPPVDSSDSEKHTKQIKKTVICLPKGLVDPGEKALEAALREVREETGVTASVITKLADIKYVYVRSWGNKEKVFKIVSFYLLRYESGKIDQISQDMRIEVARARWIKLEEGPTMLSYRGEKQMAKQALEYVMSHAQELAER